MPSLTGFVATITFAVLLAGLSAGQEPRPSDHGLNFQAPPPAKSSREMRSFFNSNKTSSTASSASDDDSSGNVTESLPPWRDTSGSGGGRLGRVLLTASLACGITGGILLLVSGLLYLIKHRRRNSEQNDSFRADDDFTFNHNTNKLELVRNR